MHPYYHSSPFSPLEIALPSSKSIAARELLLRYLSGSDTPIVYEEYGSVCDDAAELAAALRGLPPYQEMRRCVESRVLTVTIGRSGTAARCLVALLASMPMCRATLRGDEQVEKRPVGPLVEVLRGMGASIEYLGREGCLPLSIVGGELLPAGVIDARSWESSQWVSALALVAPTLAAPLLMQREQSDPSAPYIDLTLAALCRYGVSCSWVDGLITIAPAALLHPPTDLYSEGDWSAASYWYEWVALSRGRRLLALGGASLEHDGQGDRRVVELFEPLGVKSRGGGTLGYEATEVYPRGCVDLGSTPDLFPAYAVACCLLGHSVEIIGLRALRSKESDRIAAVAAGLQALGVRGLTTGDDRLVYDSTPWDRPADASPVVIESRSDHRIAMAFGVAIDALRLEGVRVDEPGCVSKSYPDFWNHLARLSTPTEVTTRKGAKVLLSPLCTAPSLSYRQQQRSTVEILLGAPYSYYSSGAPYIPSAPNRYLSISHADSWVAVALCEHSRLGVDVERLGRAQIERVASRFLTPQELLQVMSVDDTKERNLLLTLLWSAKEAAFKLLNPEPPSLTLFEAQFPMEREEGGFVLTYHPVEGEEVEVEVEWWQGDTHLLTVAMLRS